MPDEARLLVRLEASTTKLEKQLTKAASLAAREAGRMDTAFSNANKKVERGFKNAASSASVFERELTKADRQVDALRASIDPLFASTKRLADQEEILAAALRRGAISADEHARSLTLLRTQADGATISTAKLGRAQRTSTRSFGGNQIQNVAFQIGDFATQVGSGQRASVALGQQLPQLLGGFGALGAVLGAVVAIGVPLGAAFLRMRTESKSLEENMEDLKSAVQDYEAAARNAIVPTEDLRQKYGEATGAAKTFLNALLEISQVTALQQVDASVASLAETLSTVDFGFANQIDPVKGLQGELLSLIELLRDPELSREDRIKFQTSIDSINQLKSGLTGLQGELESLTTQTTVTEDSTLAVALALDRLAQSSGPQEQADNLALVQQVLETVLGTTEDLTPAGIAFVKQLNESGEAASAVAGQLERANDAATGIASTNIAGNISAAAEQAAILARNMGISLAAAGRLAAVQRNIGLPGNADGSNGTTSVQNAPTALTLPTVPERFTPIAVGGGGGGIGSRRSGGGSGQNQTPFFEDAEKQIEALNRQIEAIGKTEREVVKLEAAYALLDEAKKRGLDLDARQAESGRTLRDEIDAQAESIAKLTEQARLYEDQAALLEGINDDLKNGLADAIVEGASFSDVLKDVAQQLAKAAIQAALFGGAFGSGTGGGGGLLGNLFGGLFSGGGGGGLLSFDGGGFTGSGPRSGGVDGRGGFPAILHPNETVVDHTRGSSGGGEITLRVMAEEGEMFRPTVRAEAAGVSVSVVQEAARKQSAMRRRG